MGLLDHRIINILLLITVLGEFILPWILKHFYKGYNSKTMAMSVLGSPESPVRWIYNIWLVWLGMYLLFISVLLFVRIHTYSSALAVCTCISVSVFAMGAGILSGLFSVNESKDKRTAASRVHGAGAAIGFLTLLFFPLLQSMDAFISDAPIRGIVCAVSFVLAVLFFVFFILGDKEKFKNTAFSYEGLWERLSLLFMYVPFLYMAVENLFLS